MSKNTKIIFIIVFVFVIIGLIVGYFYFTNKQTSTDTSTTNNSWYQSFNPFGSGTTTNTPIDGGDTVSTGNTTDTTTQENQKTSLFHKLTDFGVAGATYYEETKPIIETTQVDQPAVEPTTKTTTKKVVVKKVEPKFEIIPSLRYIEKANGHLYNMVIDTKTQTKVSNSTIPSIYEAFLDGKASSVIYRYLSTDNTVSSYLATLGSASGEFLPSNITDLSISGDKNSFFYLVKNSNGVVGLTKSFNETKTNSVFNSAFSEWISQWVSGQKIFLTTKASYNTDGSVFSLNTTTSSITKVFGGVPGLTTLANNDGSLILYNSTTDTGPRLGVFNVNKHTTIDLGLYGLPEKCVWSNDNISIYCAVPKVVTGTQYPDFWYQGLISFDDYFVKIDTTTNENSTIADSTEETSVDGTKLFLNTSENQLFFINKKDYTLWSLDI
jgi:hypothetical protein